MMELTWEALFPTVDVRRLCDHNDDRKVVVIEVATSKFCDGN